MASWREEKRIFVCAKSSAFFVRGGLIFRFGFMNLIGKMNKHNIRTTVSVVNDIQEPQLEPENLETENNNMYKIIGIIDGHYIVKARKGLKKVKISGIDRKNINDEIKIEKL